MEDRKIREYDVVALKIPIAFNKWGDHDHNGMLYALEENKKKLESYKDEFSAMGEAMWAAHEYYPLVRPLVLRACVGETIRIKFTNYIEDRSVGIHLISDGYDVNKSDGARVGRNDSSLAETQEVDDNRNAINGDKSIDYIWQCEHEGTYVFHDAGDYSGMEDGTNVHGLFGALIVEPANTTWRDSSTGELTKDGLYMDIIPGELDENKKTEWLSAPVKYPEDVKKGKPRRSFREYVVFFHDEVEFAASHEGKAVDICHGQSDLCSNPPAEEHPFHPLMTISYRAEPMVARQRELWRRLHVVHDENKDTLLAPVVHEEQHHSSWMFGDPATPVLKAYIGDPVRIRLIHAGVKETHVYHLHVYSWHHDPNNRNSPIIDAISIGPQTAQTIIPLWGAGNRQGATGDVIWHCHLYPHFHEGMWGMFRTFDCLQDGGNFYPDGTPIEALNPLPDRKPPQARTPELPGFPNFIQGKPGQRSPLPPWVDDHLPLGMDYRAPGVLEKNRLNWLKTVAQGKKDRDHLNTEPIPGWMFNVFRLPKDNEEILQDDGRKLPTNFDPQEIINLSVETRRLMYNDDCWHDPEGHLFRPVEAPLVRSDDAPPNVLDERGRHDFRHSSCSNESGGHHQKFTNTPGSGTTEPEKAAEYSERDKPLFVRANHGDVVTFELENRLPRAFCLSPFDEPLPPCEKYSVPISQTDGYHDPDPHWEADTTPPMQCGLHVHLVKFDPLVCDGASTGWNYLSGPRAPYYDADQGIWRYLRMRYIWWVDEEFGTVFCHDHLFANFRQKRGLFGAMIAEPFGATYEDVDFAGTEKRFGDQAIIKYKNAAGEETAFREFCIGLGDFVPLYNRHNLALNPPRLPGGHSDHGVVGINYRSAPIRERTLSPHDPSIKGHDDKRLDPAYCFSTDPWGDPETPIFHSRPGEPIWIRLVQGSHEEQHSFQIHGMRWRRFRNDETSPLKNQQTLGISEAFTFKIEHGYGTGDYLYKFGSADDLWMGAWGIIRVGNAGSELPIDIPDDKKQSVPPFDPAKARKFRVIAERQEIDYSFIPPLSDPKGFVYRLDGMSEAGNDLPAVTKQPDKVKEPLIIRCKKGEWVEIEFLNKIPGHQKPEPQAPEVPVEIFDRSISEQASIHADLVAYDVKSSDGANIGRNPQQTAFSGIPVIYRWYAFEEGSVVLQDFTDFRNHRHHGLIGALIVEPENSKLEKFSGAQTVVRSSRKGEEEFDEIVLIIQDGLRFFQFGNLSSPMGDVPADPGEPGPDPTDQGQKAFNYRAQIVGKPNWLHFEELLKKRLYDEAEESIIYPATPVFKLRTGRMLKLRLLTIADKPRNHSFTLHGHTWEEWSGTGSPTRVGSVTSLSAGSANTLEIRLSDVPGDYAYRSGALRWAVSQGLWGIIVLTNSDQKKIRGD